MQWYFISINNLHILHEKLYGFIYDKIEQINRRRIKKEIKMLGKLILDRENIIKSKDSVI